MIRWRAPRGPISSKHVAFGRAPRIISPRHPSAHLTARLHAKRSADVTVHRKPAFARAPTHMRPFNLRERQLSTNCASDASTNRCGPRTHDHVGQHEGHVDHHRKVASHELSWRPFDEATHGRSARPTRDHRSTLPERSSGATTGLIRGELLRPWGPQIPNADIRTAA